MQNNKDIYKDMCFVIMPIGEISGRPNDHFKHVYDDILKDAIISTGFKPKRADDDKSSSMIQVDIIRDIVNAPMAICDLSTRNPNVLFELGIRQAFDLPVVLVQEEGTPRIFDISTINTIEYRKERIYHEVLEDRDKIIAAINSTRDNKKGINSIVRLLEIGRAELKNSDSLSDLDEIKLMLYSLSNEIKKSKEEKLLGASFKRNSFNDKIDDGFETLHYFDRCLYDLQSTVNAGENEFVSKNNILNRIKDLKIEIKNCNGLTDNSKSKFMNELGILQKAIIA